MGKNPNNTVGELVRNEWVNCGSRQILLYDWSQLQAIYFHYATSWCDSGGTILIPSLLTKIHLNWVNSGGM